MTATKTTVILAGAMLLALAGCSTATPEPAPSASVDATPEATETAEPAAQLSGDELAAIFTEIQFVPDEYAGTDELIGSVYPGLATSDPTCLAPFGVGWDDDDALATALEFGTSIDRSMTAVVTSTGDAEVASAVVAEASDAIARCAESAIFEMQGEAVTTNVEQTTPSLTGVDEALGWSVTGTVGGGSFTLHGLTARVGGNVVALVGWDPETSEEYVPLATQMFVDEL